MKNMQANLYTVQFSHHQFAVSPQAAIGEPRTCKFCKTPQKDQTPRKVQTPRKARIRT